MKHVEAYIINFQLILNVVYNNFTSAIFAFLLLFTNPIFYVLSSHVNYNIYSVQSFASTIYYYFASYVYLWMSVCLWKYSEIRFIRSKILVPSDRFRFSIFLITICSNRSQNLIKSWLFCRKVSSNRFFTISFLLCVDFQVTNIYYL